MLLQLLCLLLRLLLRLLLLLLSSCTRYPLYLSSARVCAAKTALFSEFLCGGRVQLVLSVNVKILDE